MDLAKALLYFYLVFPVFSPQQSELISKFRKEEIPVEQQVQIKNEILHFLFPLEQTDIAVTDPLLIDALPEENEPLLTEEDYHEEELLPEFPDESDLVYEEGVLLPDDLENPQFGPQSAGSELIEIVDEKTGEKISVAEEMYINSMNKLSLFKYGEEQFAVNNRNNNSRNLVTVNKDTVIRKRYDEEFYLKDKIVWKNADTLKDSVILSKIIYGYSITGDGKRIVTSKTEEYPQEKRIIENVYDGNGNPVEIIYSHFEENKEKYEKLIAEAKEQFNKDYPEETKSESAGQEEAGPSREELLNEHLAKIEIPLNKIRDRRIVRTYDLQDRLVTEEEATVYEEPDPKRRGQKIKKSGSKKNVYTYTAKASVPDYIYYENGKMRIAVNYIDEDTYDQTLYFEDDFKVMARYNHGRKIREIFYAGMTELKRTDFE